MRPHNYFAGIPANQLAQGIASGQDEFKILQYVPLGQRTSTYPIGNHSNNSPYVGQSVAVIDHNRGMLVQWPLSTILEESGKIGESGPIGIAGATGPMGVTGPVGPNGESGPIGMIGETGPIGATGPSLVQAYGTYMLDSNIVPCTNWPGSNGTIYAANIVGSRTPSSGMSILFDSNGVYGINIEQPGTYMITLSGFDCYQPYGASQGTYTFNFAVVNGDTNLFFYNPMVINMVNINNNRWYSWWSQNVIPPLQSNPGTCPTTSRATVAQIANANSTLYFSVTSDSAAQPWGIKCTGTFTILKVG